MSMNSLAQTAKDRGKLTSEDVIIGVVVFNNDPEKKQRIKVAIPSLLESNNVSDLPWVLPNHRSSYGVGDDYGVVQVPKIGSRVSVIFANGDLSLGQYDRDVTTANFTIPSELQTNYPNRLGGVTPNGAIYYLDLTDGSALLRQKTGTSIHIASDGTVSIVCAKDFTQVVKGNYTLSVEGNRSVIVKGNDNQQVTGNQSKTLSGNFTRQVNGSYSVVVSGSRFVSCSSETHQGSITNGGDVIANGISLIGHVHSGVDRGSSKTDGPQ